MRKKTIIINSVILITILSISVTIWILSRRISVDNNEEKVSNVTKTLDAPGHISTPKKRKEPVLKEEAQANDTQEMPEAADSSRNEEIQEFQDEEIQEFLDFLDSLTSQAESQNDEASKAEKKAAKYAALEEPLQQIRDLKAQYYSILDELTEKMNYVGRTGGAIDMGEFGRKLDERDAIARQILAVGREASKIVPDAIEIREYNKHKLPGTNTNFVDYDIIISREKLKEALGKIPPGIENLFPAKENRPIGFGIPEDENFSHYELYRRKAQNR